MFLNSTRMNKGYFYARNKMAYTVGLNPLYVMRPIFDMLIEILEEDPKLKKKTVKKQ